METTQRMSSLLMFLLAIGSSKFVGGQDLSALHEPGYSLTDALLQEVVAKMGGDPDDFLNPGSRRVEKEFEEEQRLSPPDYDNPLDTMIRNQEYLQHSSLWGHQHVAGGAGEGKQRLQPNGSIKNVQEVKTDSVLPAYCDPPNPCPPGYNAEEGCLEDFVNSAAFSREYQAAQDCMCDTEHMFDCPASSQQDQINALAQSISNVGVMDTTLDKIMHDLQIEGEHKTLVAKKHYGKEPLNPYLQGEKLPIVAKKGSNVM